MPQSLTPVPDLSAAPPPVISTPARKVSVLVVVGTRPEAIKLIPIILALRDSDRFRPIVVTTGQHDLMVREVFKLAGVWADVNLWIGDTRARLNERVASVMLRFEDFFHQWFHEVGAGEATLEDVQRGPLSRPPCSSMATPAPHSARRSPHSISASRSCTSRRGCGPAPAT